MNREKFSFSVPAKAENLTILRLATSAIASKINFSIDQIEDLKLCVSELCNLGLSENNNENFDVEYFLGENDIEIKFANLKIDTKMENFEISKMILEALIESIEFKKDSITLKLFVN